MKECAFRFGRAQHLVGVAGLPTLSTTPSDNVGVIVLNAGLVHRIGPFRMNVELTRRLNASGYSTLRFDLSTLGDSSASAEFQSRPQQICADVADAMTLLGEQSGCRRFVLVGLCSGAENAHPVACSEARTAGAVFLDGYAYRTAGFMLRHYLPRLFRPSSWRSFLTRRARADVEPDDTPDFRHEYPERSGICADLSGMLDRGLKLSFIYSGGVSRYFNHRRQFRECFGRVAVHPAVSFDYLEDTDHTYTLDRDRGRLLDIIQDWLLHNFPIVDTGPSA
jgi:hypothetical protein